MESNVESQAWSVAGRRAETGTHGPAEQMELQNALVHEPGAPPIRIFPLGDDHHLDHLGLMYLNTHSIGHVWFSQTRTWMALLMGATMSLVMLSFMASMYKSRRINLVIVAASILAFFVSLWLVGSQQTVDDVAYMKAMIPHHSIAIMTSARAHIRDPRVRKLADGIIEAQVREIHEMESLIAELDRNPPPAGAADLLPRKVP